MNFLKNVSFIIILFIPHVIFITFLFGEIITVSRTYCLRTTGGSYVPVLTISDCMRALEVSQTCTFYDADNGDEMCAKVNAFSKLYDISMNKAKTQRL